MAFEDFLTYIEVDTDNKLFVTTLMAQAVNVREHENVWLYKDKGADHFDALDIDFDIRIENSSYIDCNSGVALANVIGGVDDFAPTDFTCRIKRGGSDYRIVLTRGNWLAHDPWVCQPETHYHCTIERAAGNDTVSLKIYSNAARTALLATLVQADFGTAKWRYVYGFINRDVNIDGRRFDGYTQNLDLKELVGTTHYGSATLSGIGTLAGIGALILTGLTTLSGIGSLGVLGRRIVTGVATLGGVGILSAIGTTVEVLTHYASATLSGIGSLSAAGIVAVIHYGAATLSGIGTLVASAVTILAGKATLSGVGTLSAIGKRIVTGLATLSGTGALSVIGAVFKFGSAALSGVGSLTASAVIILAGKATLAGVGTLSAIGSLYKLASATLSGVGRLVASAVITLSGKATFAGVGTLSVIATLSGIAYGRILRIYTDVTAGRGLDFTKTIKKALSIDKSLQRRLKITSTTVEK